MKREFLTGELGLTKEVTDKIMASYGESVNRLRLENESLNEKISSFESEKESIAALEETVSSLTAEKEKLLGDFEKVTKELSQSKLEGAISSALSAAGARNIKAAEALIEKGEITLDEDGVKGLSEQVERIKKECSYLFYDGTLSSGMRHASIKENSDGFTHFARAGAKLN